MDVIRRHWALFALVLYGIAAVAVLFAPVSPGLIVQLVVDVLRDGLGWSFIRTGHVDAVLNVALFVPLGFLMTLGLRRRWLGVLLAIVLSVSAELVQTLLPARTASLRDVITNTIGALIGAGIALLVVRARSRRAAAAVPPEGEKRDPRS